MKRILCALIFFMPVLFMGPASAQVQFEQNPFEKGDIFRYQSIRSDFWIEVDEKLDKNDIAGVISLASGQSVKKLKQNEKAEVYLAIIEAAVKSDHPYLAFVLIHEISKIFPLSNQALRSYFLLEQIFKKHSLFDELIVGETVLEQDINLDSNRIPFEIKGFIAYLLFQSHRAQGFAKWEKSAQKWIPADSEWAYRSDYDHGLYELFNNRLDSSIKIFETLMNNEKVSDLLRKKAKRQYARLIFEKGEFQKTFDLLKSLQFEQDDRGLILLERAWTKYYLKHYSKALGLLTALDASVFDQSRTPETDILKMLIYKELCHYEAVADVKKDFDRRYKKSIDTIKKRGDLLKDTNLLKIALINPQLKNYSLFISGLRRDMNWFRDLASSGDLMKELQTKVTAKDRQLQDMIGLKLKDRIRKTAEEMLDWSEQVNFLDYQTRVDSLRIRRSDKELNYRPEAIPLMTFDRLYWIYKGELWLDELENLRVLVKSKCQSTN